MQSVEIEDTSFWFYPCIIPRAICALLIVMPDEGGVDTTFWTNSRTGLSRDSIVTSCLSCGNGVLWAKRDSLQKALPEAQRNGHRCALDGIGFGGSLDLIAKGGFKAQVQY
jgi:hypothetical protein